MKMIIKGNVVSYIAFKKQKIACNCVDFKANWPSRTWTSRAGLCVSGLSRTLVISIEIDLFSLFFPLLVFTEQVVPYSFVLARSAIIDVTKFLTIYYDSPSTPLIVTLFIIIALVQSSQNQIKIFLQ